MFEVVAGRRRLGLRGLGPTIPTASAGLHALLLLGLGQLDTGSGPAPSGVPPDESVTFLRIRAAAPAPAVQAATAVPKAGASAEDREAIRRAPESQPDAPKRMVIPAELAAAANLDLGALLPTGVNLAAGFVPRAIALEIEERPSLAASSEPRRSSRAITDGSLLSQRPALLNAYRMRRAWRKLYPDTLQSDSVEGEALVGFEIEKDGKVDLATFDLIYASHPEFASAAREGIKQLRFSPARRQGMPVRVRVHFPIRWKLPKDGSRT